MRCFAMFVTAVCILFLLKLKWPKNKSFWGTVFEFLDGIIFAHDVMYEKSHIWTAVEDESEEWSSQLIFQFKPWERRSLKKNQGFNGIQARHFCDTGAMLYQLSYEATHWERGQFIENYWQINRDDHSSLSSTTAVQIWIISYILHIISLLKGG